MNILSRDHREIKYSTALMLLFAAPSSDIKYPTLKESANYWTKSEHRF
jgi:hypothetical protein